MDINCEKQQTNMRGKDRPLRTIDVECNIDGATQMSTWVDKGHMDKANKNRGEKRGERGEASS
jgi:hypothetical protein